MYKNNNFLKIRYLSNNKAGLSKFGKLKLDDLIEKISLIETSTQYPVVQQPKMGRSLRLPEMSPLPYHMIYNTVFVGHLEISKKRVKLLKFFFLSKIFLVILRKS